jgi:iron complex outermembrane receptor protein
MTLPFSVAAYVARRAATLLLLPAALVAQGNSGQLVGRVVTGDVGVPGATVLASNGRATQTRTDGRYRMTLPAGRYEIRVRVIGYNTASDSVTIVAGGTTTADFSLQRAIATLQAVSTIGTRGTARTVIDAPVPIDVLSAAEIKATGRTETAQMIQALAPSFNFPRATIGDGTDHVRPSTLRGLGPDQALVLINGKRRHTSALVNVNGTIGRGSTGVDLNAIPASMIDHIEILRDGAAAQYGSDAIAGVMNIVLKSGKHGDLVLTSGGNVTTYNRSDDVVRSTFPGGYPTGQRSARDGKVFQASIDKGIVFGTKGFVHGAFELRDRGYTNRSLPDLRVQYFGNSPFCLDTRCANYSTPPAPDTLTHRQGDAWTHDVQLFLNAANEFSNGLELYGFGGATRRKGEAAGFFRRSRDDRTLRQIYPRGFLPLISSTIDDYSGTVGVRGMMNEWKWDLSTVYGRNKFRFDVKSSNNAILPPTMPQTEFYAGDLIFGQSTTNLDLFRAFPVLQEMRVAVGAEFRAENFRITPGEPTSFATDTAARVLDSLGNRTTRRPAPFSQVFPGFSPVQQTDRSRNNVAGYVDVETDITRNVLVGVAARVERYSDFGSTTTGKLSGRYEPVKNYALRGAISTGFRAPSLGQSYFQSTATNFVPSPGGLVPLEIRTLPVDDPLAQRLGARPLKPEKSVNISAGFALQPIPALSFTADYYRINITDRIVLSENLTGSGVVAFFAANGRPEVTGARYFTNALNTRTNGLDIIANFGHSFANEGVLRLTAGMNFNDSKLTQIDSIAQQTAVPAQLLQFGRIEQIRTERGQPKNNMLLSANYNLRNVGALLRTQRFGPVTIAGSSSAAADSLDQTFGAKWITDANVSYTFARIYTLTAGADNIFDVYPDRNKYPGNPLDGPGGIPGGGVSGTGNVGIFPYSGVTPFGFNGRFVYGKLSIYL